MVQAPWARAQEEAAGAPRTVGARVCVCVGGCGWGGSCQLRFLSWGARSPSREPGLLTDCGGILPGLLGAWAQGKSRVCPPQRPPQSPEGTNGPGSTGEGDEPAPDV